MDIQVDLALPETDGMTEFTLQVPAEPAGHVVFKLSAGKQYDIMVLQSRACVE